MFYSCDPLGCVRLVARACVLFLPWVVQLDLFARKSSPPTQSSVHATAMNPPYRHTHPPHQYLRLDPCDGSKLCAMHRGLSNIWGIKGFPTNPPICLPSLLCLHVCFYVSSLCVCLHVWITCCAPCHLRHKDCFRGNALVVDHPT